MSDIKEELNYYKADEFLDKYMKGEMNIHLSIQLKNRTQTTIYHVSLLHHLLHSSLIFLRLASHFLLTKIILRD